jgi:hypothetical protein
MHALHPCALLDEVAKLIMHALHPRALLDEVAKLKGVPGLGHGSIAVAPTGGCHGALLWSQLHGD